MSDDDVEQILTGLGKIARIVMKYKDSDMKAAVFNAMMGMISEIKFFRDKVKMLEFLKPPLHVSALDHGIVVFTKKNLQLNVHFAIPIYPEVRSVLLVEMSNMLEAPIFEDFALNLTPLRGSYKEMTGDCSRRRRVIPKSANGRLILIDDNTVQWNDRKVTVKHFINNVMDLQYFFPLSRASEDCGEEEFWAKTACSKIVVIFNPILPFEEASDCPAILDAKRTFNCFPPELHYFLHSLCPARFHSTSFERSDSYLPGAGSSQS